MRVSDVTEILERAERIGASEDVPEGSRVIQLSETLVMQMIQALRKDSNL